MRKMTLNSIKKENETSVSNVFLDYYMKDAHGEFVKVYLYLLRCMNSSSAAAVQDIADNLNLTEKDVVRALKYWASVNVLSIDFDKESGEPSSITFLPLEVPHSSESAAVTSSRMYSDMKEAASSVNNSTAIPDKPSYSTAAIRQMKEREDLRQLLYIIETYLGKTLTGTDINTVLYIHDTLGFSSDLIEYLVEYCVSNQHSSLHYMESVAIRWKEQGITTVADAKNSSAIHNKKVSSVARAFGINNRNITPVEMDFINRWYDEYGFDRELIVEACKRTILSMAKPNFSYADGILRKWKSAGIHTMSDLKILDDGFRTRITVPVSNKQTSGKTVNKFNNFSQREYDFDEMEKTLISNNK